MADTQTPVYPFNGIIRRARMPALGQTVNGEMIVIPRAAVTMTIHVVALVGVATTLALQSLNPDIAPGGAEVWDQVIFISEGTDGTVDTYVLIDAIPEEQVTVLYQSNFGAGIVRLVASADQSSAPIFIPIVFGF